MKLLRGIGWAFGAIVLGVGLVLSAPGRGGEGRPLAFGPFHLPTDLFAQETFTGAFRALRPESAQDTLRSLSTRTAAGRFATGSWSRRRRPGRRGWAWCSASTC